MPLKTVTEQIERLGASPDYFFLRVTYIEQVGPAQSSGRCAPSKNCEQPRNINMYFNVLLMLSVCFKLYFYTIK